MFNKSNVKALGFALIVCVVCALLLSLCADLLRDRQEKNALIDQRKNILKALKVTDKKGASPEEITEFFASASGATIEDVYQTKINAIAIDPEGKEVGKLADLSEKQLVGLMPVYQHVEDGKVLSYAIPVSGKGLWSTLYGFLALEEDLNTVKGITFYKHGETPGLGAEIDQSWFQDNFVGKKILNDKGELVSITVMKGQVDANTPDKEHKVDGISGATMTANGVTQLLEKDLNAYNKYFTKIRSGSNG